MKQSQSAKRQPLLIMLTTAGTVRKCIFDDMYKYACEVADGTIADSNFLSILYELDERKEWLDPMAWEKANPGLNRIKKLDDLIGKVERAKNSPRDLTSVLVKDFNVISTVGTAWLTFDNINNTENFETRAPEEKIPYGQMAGRWTAETMRGQQHQLQRRHRMVFGDDKPDDITPAWIYYDSYSAK